jgi:hypothetical protein
MEEREISVEPIGNGCGTLGTSSVGRDNHAVSDVKVLPDVLDGSGFGVEIVNGDIKEALYLRGVEIHRNDVIAARFAQHVGNELGGDGRPGLVFLVLSGVEEVGDDGGDAAG